MFNELTLVNIIFNLRCLSSANSFEYFSAVYRERIKKVFIHIFIFIYSINKSEL